MICLLINCIRKSCMDHQYQSSVLETYKYPIVYTVNSAQLELSQSSLVHKVSVSKQRSRQTSQCDLKAQLGSMTAQKFDGRLENYNRGSEHLEKWTDQKDQRKPKQWTRYSDCRIYIKCHTPQVALHSHILSQWCSLGFLCFCISIFPIRNRNSV